MLQIIKLVRLCFISLLAGCAGMSEEHITGQYYLTKMDYVDKDQGISYYLGHGNYIGVVPATVFAIGFNDGFIIAKQHPSDWSSSTIYKKITNYYIIPLKFEVHHSPDENRIGPLTYKQFCAKKKELNIPDELDFTKVFKTLE